MSKVDWSLAPKGATHWVGGMHPWHQNIGTTVFYWSTCGGCWKKLTGFDVDQVNSQYLGVIQERPKQPQAWSGQEDGLPPVGSIVIARRSDTNKWHESEVLRHNTQYQRNGVCAFMEVKSNMMFWSNEYKAIKTPEQLASEKRETAIREFMDVVGIDCRVTASKAIDAGFKREVV